MTSNAITDAPRLTETAPIACESPQNASSAIATDTTAKPFNVEWLGTSADKLGRRLFAFFFGLLRTGIESLGINVAIDELDDRHRRRIAMAEPGFQNSRVTTSAVGISVRKRG